MYEKENLWNQQKCLVENNSNAWYLHFLRKFVQVCDPFWAVNKFATQNYSIDECFWLIYLWQVADDRRENVRRLKRRFDRCVRKESFSRSTINCSVKVYYFYSMCYYFTPKIGWKEKMKWNVCKKKKTRYVETVKGGI